MISNHIVGFLIGLGIGIAFVIASHVFPIMLITVSGLFKIITNKVFTCFIR